MASFRKTLRKIATDGMNAVQERVVEFERNGGIATIVSRAEKAMEMQQTLLLEGRHPLLPEQQRRVRQWYARMELPFGADEQDVRNAYRRLMRQYHPDRFARSAEGEVLATRLSQELTEAYTGLLQHLKRSGR